MKFISLILLKWKCTGKETLWINNHSYFPSLLKLLISSQLIYPIKHFFFILPLKNPKQTQLFIIYSLKSAYLWYSEIITFHLTEYWSVAIHSGCIRYFMWFFDLRQFFKYSWKCSCARIWWYGQLRICIYFKIFNWSIWKNSKWAWKLVNVVLIL